MMEYISLVMFFVLVFVIFTGYPVAFALTSTAIAFGLYFVGWDYFGLLPLRIWGSLTNPTFLAVPLFVFMGTMLEKSGLAEELLDVMFILFRRIRGGLAISVVVVGALLAASTGIVGATVITMGLIALPNMLRHNYSKTLATGTIAASGTLGQIIPPSVILIILAEITGVSVKDLFVGAFIPGMLLVVFYIIYILIISFLYPDMAPAATEEELSGQTLHKVLIRTLKGLVPPFFLILAVLGSIFYGFASPTEAAAVGAAGSIALTIFAGKFTFPDLQEVMDRTMTLTCMVFFVLVGATAFGLIFRGLGGDDMIHHFLNNIAQDHSAMYSLAIVMFVIFILGFFLDFIEITFITLPIVMPAMNALGFDPLWFSILVAVNLQTSFLTPPFGFSLFYLKAVSPPSINTLDIYKGIIPFVIIQLICLLCVVLFPELATWLPKMMAT